MKATFKIKANSKKNEIIGIDEKGFVKIKIASVPEDGKANKELIKFLSKKIGIKKNMIKIVRGEFTPIKIIEIEEFDEQIFYKLII